MSEDKKTRREELEDKIMYLKEDIDLYDDPQDKKDLAKVKARLAELKSED